MYKKGIKRVLDFTLSLAGLIILSPVMLIVAVLVRVKLGSPVLFTQERPGYHEKIFKMYKFRTMKDAVDDSGKKLTDKERLEKISENKVNQKLNDDEQRLTPFGKKLRKLSLDELPELFNILKGDMSIVGPRPLVSIYLPYYTEEERRRHSVRPGLTGMAQVHGRNSSSWKERFQYDVEYVDHVSFLTDVKILIQTVLVVFKQEGIGQGSEKPVAFHIERMREREEEMK